MPTTIDDYEDGDLSEYAVTKSWTGNHVQTSTDIVHSGSRSLQFKIDAAQESATVGSSPGSGLNYYPSAGDTFELFVYTDNAAETISVHFGGTPQSGSSYEVAWTNGGSNGELELKENFAGTTLDTAGLSSYPETQWTRFEVDWGATGSITARLYDVSGTKLAEVSGTDATASSGGVGMHVKAAWTVVEVFFDDFRTAAQPPSAPTSLIPTLE